MLEDIYLQFDMGCSEVPEGFQDRSQIFVRNVGPAIHQLVLAINDMSAPVQEVHGVKVVLPETSHFQQMLLRVGFLESLGEFLSFWHIGVFNEDRRHTFGTVSQPFVQPLDKFGGNHNSNPNRGL